MIRWASPDGRDPIGQDERWSIAVHEAGHALLAWRWNMDVLRITVRSRQSALGMVQWDMPERSYNQSRQHLFGQLQMTLGGLAAEQALLGRYDAGGTSDLSMAHRLLRFSLAEAGLGNLGPASAGREQFWSERRRQQMEHEVHVWSTAAFDDAVTWLTDQRVLVENLARVLLEVGDLSGPGLLPHAQAVHLAAEPRPQPPQPVAWALLDVVGTRHGSAGAEETVPLQRLHHTGPGTAG